MTEGISIVLNINEECDLKALDSFLITSLVGERAQSLKDLCGYWVWEHTKGPAFGGGVRPKLSVLLF